MAKGWRCAVCIECGRCFTKTADDEWQRCEVCVGCGKCAERWGLLSSGDVDGQTHATDMAGMAARLDAGTSRSKPPATPAAPGQAHSDCDATTGATPGVSAACQELGLADMNTVLLDLGIKPPGQS